MSRIKLQSGILFCGSALLGILFSLAYHRVKGVSKDLVRWTSNVPHEEIYKSFLDSKQIKQTTLADSKSLQIIQESIYLHDTVRVFCAVILQKPDATRYMKSDAVQTSSPVKAIKDTWAPRCNKVIYFSHKPLTDTNWIGLESENLSEWRAFHEVLSHLFRAKYIDQFDWFLFTEQDTFVIMENLRYYLSVYNAGTPYFFGHAFESWDSSYNAAGPGVVLSKSAMRKLHSTLLKGHCAGSSSSAESELARCLEDVGVFASDTRDFQGRARFLMYQPEFLLVPGMLPWNEKYWTNSKFLSKEGPDCCSDYAISFHYVPPNMMYVFDYLVYHLTPYGITQQLSSPLQKSESGLQADTLGQSILNPQKTEKPPNTKHSTLAQDVNKYIVRTTFPPHLNGTKNSGIIKFAAKIQATDNNFKLKKNGTRDAKSDWNLKNGAIS